MKKAYLRMIVYLAITTVIVFILFIIFMPSKIATLRLKLAAHGVPMTPQELAEHYYNGQEATITIEELETLSNELGKIEIKSEDKAFVIDTLRDIHASLRPGIPLPEDQKNNIAIFFEALQDIPKRIDAIFLATPAYKVKREYNYNVFGLMLPDISLIRNCAVIHAVTGHLALDENDMPTALAEHAKIEKLIKNITEDHILISLHVGLHCDLIAEKLFADMLLRGIVSKEQFIDFAKQAEESEKMFFAVLNKTIQAEASCGLLLFEGLRNKSISYSEIGDFLATELTFFGRLIYNMNNDQEYYCEYYIKIFDGGYLLPSKVMPDMTSFEKPPTIKTTLIFSRNLLPPIAAVTTRFYRSIAHIRMRRIVCEIEIFKLENAGNLPEKLADLKMPDMPVDPFSGDEFKFEKKDDGYIIYSLGENKLDDGGNPEKNTDEVIEVYIKK